MGRSWPSFLFPFGPHHRIDSLQRPGAGTVMGWLNAHRHASMDCSKRSRPTFSCASVTQRGQRKRITLPKVPALSSSSPFSHAVATILLTMAALGVFYSSLTNSIPIMAPVPRTSPMTLNFSFHWLNLSMQVLEIFKAFPG